MVDSRTTEPRDYFSRREQWRLLFLVMSLGLIVFLMNEVRKPERWYWLFGEQSGQQSEKTGSPGGVIESDQPADPQDRPAEPLSEPKPPSGVAFESEPFELPGDADGSSRYYPGVKPRLLATIRDKSRFVPEEQEAWFHLFQILEKSDPAELRRESTGRILRIQLLEQSEAYRGELVTIGGTVRRAHWLNAPKNAFGITGYYRLWLWPDENPNWPIVVYSLTVPGDFPTGMTISEHATVTGFYFKRWLHETKGGLDLVPVVLAGGVEQQKPATSLAAEPLGLGAAVAIVIGAVVLAVGIVSYVYRRTRRAKRHFPPRLGIMPEEVDPS